MAQITRSSTVSMDVNSGMKAHYISGLTAGSAISAGDCCYIDDQGKVLRTDSSLHTSGSIVYYAGFAPKAYASGEACTLVGAGARFDYSSGMTPGEYLSSGSTSGSLINTAFNVNDLPVALAISSTDIQIIR